MKFQPFYSAAIAKKVTPQTKANSESKLADIKYVRPPDIAKPSDPYKWIGGQIENRCCGGADSRTRTDDLLITNELLYQLSHISIFDLILYDTSHIALTANDLLIYSQKYSRLARLSLSQFSLFLPFASSLHLPLAAVACSANELLYQLSHISI